MKKVLGIVLGGFVLLSLCACGGTQGSSDSGSSGEASGEQSYTTAGEGPAETTAAESNDSGAGTDAAAASTDSGDSQASDSQTGGDLTTINAGKLTMSMSADFPPYEFLDDSGTITGIEPEIMTIIAGRLGLEPQFDDMDFDSALLAVQQNKSDMVVSGVTVTDDRKLVMNFTDSYTTAVQVVMVPEGSDVTLDNIADKTIGTQRGTTGFIYCEDDYGADHVIGYDTYSIAVQALLNGQVDCLVLDNGPAKAFASANPSLVILDTEYVTENYAFGVDKNNEALLNAVNTELNSLIADGTVQGIIDKYISE